MPQPDFHLPHGVGTGVGALCNLYNITTSQRAFLDFTQAMDGKIGNLEPSFDVFPDNAAPLVPAKSDGTKCYRTRFFAEGLNHSTRLFVEELNHSE